MTVELYVGKDPEGRAWAPDFTHEAEAAIRLAGKCWRAYHASREVFLLAFNLHNPNIDLLVMSERGLGIVETKAHHGAITIGADEFWLAGGRKMLGYREIPGREPPASAYRNPHQQVQGQGALLMDRFLPVIRADYPELTKGKRRNIRIQTTVCFTNPEADLAEARTTLRQWNDGRLKPWESDFSLTTAEDLADWVATLRFEVKQIDVPPYYPFRLEPAKMHTLLDRLFAVERWSAVERLLPVTRYGFLRLVRGDRTLATSSLWEEETYLGRDPFQCTIVVPHTCTRVSRRHAVIRRELEGVVIEDLNSNNGTYLDGRRISGTVRLPTGARIALGGAGDSEKECSYVFRVADGSGEELDTTEEGTQPGSTPQTPPKDPKPGP